MSAIDLRRQVKFGEEFALLPEAGGTGRVDGYTKGLYIVATTSPDFGGAVARGQVVERIGDYNIGPALSVKPTNAATDQPYGVALEDIAVSTVPGAIAIAGGPVYVLTTGTIAEGDTLYTSGTTGRATATAVAGAAALGVSLNDATGTSAVWALLRMSLPTLAGSIDHGGLTGLSDDDHTQYLLESLADAKGDLLAATAADTWTRVAVGSNGTVLTADSSASSGVSWQTTSGGGSHILIADEHSTPLVFDDLLQNSEGNDLLYASE